MIGRALIITGMVLILIGLMVLWKNPFLWFGRLPGDFAIEKENFKFYVPLASCLVVSALLSAILYLFRR